MNDNEKQEIIELIKELRTPDSIEIGNSKTGTIKCYVDFHSLVIAEEQLESAVELLKESIKEVLEP